VIDEAMANRCRIERPAIRVIRFSIRSDQSTRMPTKSASCFRGRAPTTWYGRLGFTAWFSTFTVLAVLAFSAQPHTGAARTDDVRHRKQMVDEVLAMASAMADVDRIDARVLAALAKVPRHEFVPADQKPHAYDNRPLPIGHGQTISQPYIVAIMTALMNVQPDHAVLEIGTGSGYQAAVLAELAHAVYTIEIIEPLAKQAAQRLQRLGYANVTTRIGDGYYGWPKGGLFDSIIVTAAASHIPPPLLRQLKPGGRMVIPIGAPFMTQQLMLVEKLGDGAVKTRQLMPVRFVSFTGGH
jgi:protein-L-isoaspartate(D-aspartate) O-methyltransferase